MLRKGMLHGKKIFFLKRILAGRSCSSSSLSWTDGGRVVDMASKDGELRVFMVAGEVSGDVIASRLISSLKRLSPFPIRFSGVGGVLMSKEGLQSLYPMEDISVMGFWEVFPHIRKIRMRLKETIEAAILFRPHVVVTIDSKAFSFRFLKQLRARCIGQGLASPVQTHYVAPSFWAWKGGETRLPQLSGYVDHLLCILPFEEEVCRSNGLAATFVGHPTLEDALTLNSGKDPPSEKWKVQGNDQRFRNEHGLSSEGDFLDRKYEPLCQFMLRTDHLELDNQKFPPSSFDEDLLGSWAATIILFVAAQDPVQSYFLKFSISEMIGLFMELWSNLFAIRSSILLTRYGLCLTGATVITLLPGSRLQEVKLMLPTFLNTVKLLKDPFPKVTAVIPVAPNQHVESYIDRAIQTWDIPTILISGRLQDLKYNAFNASRAALTTAGTAIMELQLARLPCVVAYRAHVLTEWLIRYKTKLRYMALPNILLDSPIIPEVLFRACTPKNLASILSQVIHDGQLREQQIITAEKMFELLSPSERSICDLATKEVGLPFTDSSPSMIAASTILYSAKRKCQSTHKGPFVLPISPIM